MFSEGTKLWAVEVDIPILRQRQTQASEPPSTAAKKQTRASVCSFCFGLLLPGSIKMWFGDGVASGISIRVCLHLLLHTPFWLMEYGDCL